MFAFAHTGSGPTSVSAVDAPLTPLASDTPAPSRKALLWIALGAIAFRIAVMLVLSLLRHESIAAVAVEGDGKSYLYYANWMLGHNDGSEQFHFRVFPGLPALMVGLHVVTRLPLVYAGLLIGWIASGVAAAASAHFYRDTRVGIAMLVALPDYLMTGTCLYTESPLLALTMAGLILAGNRRNWTGGLLLGIAGTFRPMACFAVIGYGVLQLYRRNLKPAIITGLMAGLVIVLALIGLKIGFGDPLKGAKLYHDSPGAYNGDLFSWPGKSLIFMSLAAATPKLKVAYVWAHVALVAAALYWITRRTFRRGQAKDPLDILSLPWLASNTLFVLMVGSHWGFNAFGRFLSPALPALFWGLTPILPRRWWAWVPIGVAVAAQGVINAMRH